MSSDLGRCGGIMEEVADLFRKSKDVTSGKQTIFEIHKEIIKKEMVTKKKTI